MAEVYGAYRSGAVHELFDAVRTFFSELASVEWGAVGIALGFQLARLLCRAVAWRAILAAAFPAIRIPIDRVTGAYFAGTGINAVAPARSGDVVKLVLVKHEVPGTTYTTLAPTLLVETLFDAVVASVVLFWALFAGVLPALDVLPSIPTLDWSWPIDHPRPALVIFVVWATVLTLLVIIWSRRVRDFREQIRHGFAILREPRRFFAQVVTWQALSWVFRIAGVWFFLDAFDIPTTARNVMLVLAVQSLSTLLPFTPGGLGTQQGFLLYAFRSSSVPHTALVAFSVGMQLATNAFNFVVGLIALALLVRTLNWRKVVARGRAEVDQAESGS
jgi:glycosyltransferase 2 family protein